GPRRGRGADESRMASEERGTRGCEQRPAYPPCCACRIEQRGRRASPTARRQSRGPAGRGRGGTQRSSRRAVAGARYWPRVAAGVGVGLDQPAPIGRDAYAARVAVPIWADFMKRIARSYPPREFVVPAGLSGVDLCAVTHLKPVAECPTYVEYFKEGDEIPS